MRGFDPMDINLASANQPGEWWNAGWPTPEESTQSIVDLDFAEGGKGKEKSKDMQFGGRRNMSPIQMMLAAINAIKGVQRIQQQQLQQQRRNKRLQRRQGFRQRLLQLWWQSYGQRVPSAKEGDEGILQVWQNLLLGKRLQSSDQRNR